MNHLAHIVLAGPEEGMRLGAFLGDHIKGREALNQLPPQWQAGVLLHRRIDALTDAHPAVGRLLEGLEPPWRRYGGVIHDVLFDCMLTRHWQDFGPTSLKRLGAQIDDLLATHRLRLPDRLVRFSRWAAQRKLWQRYAERAMLEEIFELLARRHGRRWPRGFVCSMPTNRLSRVPFLNYFPICSPGLSQSASRLCVSWSDRSCNQPQRPSVHH